MLRPHVALELRKFMNFWMPFDAPAMSQCPVLVTLEDLLKRAEAKCL